MHQLLHLIPVLLSSLLTTTHGCGRTPATPRPTTVAPVTVTTTFVSHRKPCTANETQAQGCLNGGTCFVLEIEEGEERTTHCQCQENYIGKTCFYIDPTLIFQRSLWERDDRVKAAAIAASVVGIVLFVTAIVCVLVLRKRYLRRKEMEKREEKEKQPLHDQETVTGGNSEESTLVNGGHQVSSV